MVISHATDGSASTDSETGRPGTSAGGSKKS
jgi:hypothetical protein